VIALAKIDYFSQNKPMGLRIEFFKNIGIY